MEEIRQGTCCVVNKDIVVGEHIVFEKGEEVVIEEIDPNPENPEYKYVAHSESQGRLFQLREEDLVPLLQRPLDVKKKSQSEEESDYIEAEPSAVQREKPDKCPFCAEWIKAEAIKCRYCGSDLVKPKPKLEARITRDIKSGGKLAFERNECVQVERVTPEIGYPDKKYLTFSTRLNRKLRLSGGDISLISTYPKRRKIVTKETPVSGSLSIRKKNLIQQVPKKRGITVGDNKSIALGILVLLIIATVFTVIFVVKWMNSPVKETVVPRRTVVPQEYVSPTADPRSGAMTLAKYDQIQNGMTHEQVVSIAGGEPQMASEGSNMVMCIWYAEDGTSNACVTFTDGLVSTKAQLGLK